MPLPDDEKLLALAQDLIGQFDSMFGSNPGFRPAHAKGKLLTGMFTATADAASLSRAPHFNRASTPVTVRFSNSTGIPTIPDFDAKANPRGMAVRFHLAERVHTDIVSHAIDGFPTRTGQEFLELLRAATASDPSKIQSFLQSRPKALAFIQAPKPTPVSFGNEQYFGVTAMRFIKGGNGRHGRYRIVPKAGIEHLSDEFAAAKGPDFLFEELAARIREESIGFRLLVQLANDGDVVDDATIHWPEDRTVLELGDIALTQELTADDEDQRHIIFDPIPRVDGIEPSDDPLLELRAAIYLLSGRRRRAAGKA